MRIRREYSASCKKWLNVNTDPDNPNNQSVLVQNRLPWIEHFYQYTSGVTNYRTSCQAGVFYSTSGSQNTFSTTWQCSTGNVTTPYQTWFVEVSSNVVDLYNKAEKEGAYHYMAAADVFNALGYMEMLDFMVKCLTQRQQQAIQVLNLMMVKPFTTDAWQN